jgi:hypothetical protein
MLRNYIKLALRNLFRQKVFSIINILGLSIPGLVALAIGLITVSVECLKASLVNPANSLRSE